MGTDAAIERPAVFGQRLFRRLIDLKAVQMRRAENPPRPPHLVTRDSPYLKSAP